MAEYIEREALKERFRKRIKWLEKDVHDQYSLGLFHGCEYDADLINEPPAADVTPVRHGRWIEPSRLYYGAKQYECSLCYSDTFWNKHSITEKYPHCPNCGAIMDLNDLEDST